MKTTHRRISRRQLALYLALAALAFIGAAYFAVFSELPDPDTLITRSSPDTSKIYDRNGKLLYEILDPHAGRRTRVALGDLPPALKNAVISVEDANFYDHPGVDIVGVGRALWQFMRAGEIVSGGSTITQQLARELLLTRQESEERTVTRKLREMVLALRLTQTYSKDQVLESYLNETYFGNLAYGVEAAAHTYFGKPARDLDLAEAALLAGMIQSPSAYNPLVNYDAARERQKVVLDLMVKHGYISSDNAQLAASEGLHFQAPATDAQTLRAPHFVNYVRNLLEAEYGAEAVNQGGLRVVTTLDLDLQMRAEAIVKQKLDDLARRTRQENAPDYNLHDAALVALDPRSGEILAMVGSADYFDSKIDGAVNVALANRQPGSAIKPITYATAFSQDYTPATVLSDVPTTFTTKENQPYEPQNYDRQWHGPITLRRALATSSNMVAVKVLDHVGLNAMIATAKALGITTFEDSDRFGLALTLGGGEVKLLELTSAYAAFANQGKQVVPRAILRVSDAERTTEYPPSDDTPKAVSPQVAYLITSILSDDSARIPAFGEDSVLNLTRPAAAKTGTTSDFRDNWTVGYTPNLTVGVWAGNADNEAMYKVTGITGAAPIWHDFMEEALRSIPIEDFQRPDGIVEKGICESSGLVPTENCPRVRSEIFIQGTEPMRTDDSYQAFALDSATGLLWTDGCQGQQIQRVFRVFPADAQDWADKQHIPEPPTQNCLGQVAAEGGESLLVGSSNRNEAPLVITSPPNNSTYELSPQLPPGMQELEIGARLGSAVRLRQVTLMIDGQPIGTFSGLPYRALWQLNIGAHQLKAVGIDNAGRTVESAPVNFSVVGN